MAWLADFGRTPLVRRAVAGQSCVALTETDRLLYPYSDQSLWPSGEGETLDRAALCS